MTSDPTALERQQGRGSFIAVAMGVMSVATYLYTMVAARLLGPRNYGAFAALMGLLLVIAVLQLGLQATGARRIAANPHHAGEIEASMRRVTWLSAWGLGGVCLLAAPVVDAVLHLDSVPTAVLVAVTAVPLTVMGGQAGILQGERRWTPLALLYVASGVPRLVIGTALIWFHPTEFAAMAGVAIGAVFPVVIGRLALRHPRAHVTPSGQNSVRTVLTEAAHNSHALLAFFALSNADVLIARNVLDNHQAGLYAAGTILVKAVLFLPQFVVVLAFPSMSEDSGGRRARSALLGSVALILGIGLLISAGTAALSGLALTFVGGSAYAGIQDQLFGFALLGTVLSMLQMLIYDVVARQHRRAVYLVWATLLAELAVGQFVSSVTVLLGVVALGDTLLLLGLLGLAIVLPARAQVPAHSS